MRRLRGACAGFSSRCASLGSCRPSTRVARIIAAVIGVTAVITARVPHAAFRLRGRRKVLYKGHTEGQARADLDGGVNRTWFPDSTLYVQLEEGRHKISIALLQGRKGEVAS